MVRDTHPQQTGSASSPQLPCADDGAGICFLMGAPRSGTTWLQRLLQLHPAICGDEESHFFSLFAHPMRAAHDLATQGESRKIGPLCYIEEEPYRRLFAELWAGIFRTLYQDNPNAKIHLEKTPAHTMHLDQVTRLFPKSKVIFIARDSRAVTASLLHASATWGKYFAPSTTRGATTVWWRHVTAFFEWQAENPDFPCLFLRYEDVIEDRSGALQKVLEFLGVDVSGVAVRDLLAAYDVLEKNKVDPAGFARKRGADGWKKDLSKRQMLEIYYHTRGQMRALGYDIRLFS